jgi:hypothetical protein
MNGSKRRLIRNSTAEFCIRNGKAVFDLITFVVAFYTPRDLTRAGAGRLNGLRWSQIVGWLNLYVAGKRGASV